MRNQYLLFALAFFILMGSVSAASPFLPHQQLTNYSLIYTADNATGCILTYISYPDKTASPFLNLDVPQNGGAFRYDVQAPNFSQLGDTCMFYTCTNPLATPTTASSNTCVNVTTDGSVTSPVEITIYVFFLLCCLLLIYLSIKLMQNNPYKEDKLSPQQKYELKNKDTFEFYLELLKKKFWIIGVFGVYLAFFLFSTILNKVVLDLGIGELNILLIYLNNILAWGSIPFVVFWIAYIILYLYKGTKDILMYQFGGLR